MTPEASPAASAPSVTVALLNSVSVGEWRGRETRVATTAAADPARIPVRIGHSSRGADSALSMVNSLLKVSS
jgi:hypothetical protein